MSWMMTEEEMQKRESVAFGARFGPSRFRLKPGEKTSIFMVSPKSGMAIYEHTFEIDGKWHNITCDTREASPYCCERLGRGKSRKGSRAAVYFYTVVDCSEWFDNAGNSRQYEVKLFPAKFSAQDSISEDRQEYEKKGSTISGRKVNVRRGRKPTSPAVGSKHEFKKPVDLAKVFPVANYKGRLLSEMWDEAEKDPEKMKELKALFQVDFDANGRLVRTVPEFNYEIILAPPSRAELDALLDGDSDYDGSKSSGGSKSSNGSKSSRSFAVSSGNDLDEDDIPF